MPQSLVDIRIYRAAFVLALLALVVCMFSLEERPPAAHAPRLLPTPSTSRPPSTTTREIVGALSGPARREARGDAALAGRGRRAGSRNLGFETSRDEFSADVGR